MFVVENPMVMSGAVTFIFLVSVSPLGPGSDKDTNQPPYAIGYGVDNPGVDWILDDDPRFWVGSLQKVLRHLPAVRVYGPTDQMYPPLWLPLRMN